MKNRFLCFYHLKNLRLPRSNLRRKSNLRIIATRIISEKTKNRCLCFSILRISGYPEISGHSRMIATRIISEQMKNRFLCFYHLKNLRLPRSNLRRKSNLRIIATRIICEETKNRCLCFSILRISGYPEISGHSRMIATRIISEQTKNRFLCFYHLKNLRLPRNLKLLQNDCYQNNFGRNEKSFPLFLSILRISG